ncbi:beta strand repeat-containing protein [Deinococcus planocerae]|uniref:beta strand repeat-containing protein n=1 Tax=Deinococcus planocerae TaxID=1737569 RepID=UPI0011AF0278|nr:PxKF domain-containing protein [Deinococcus planocerae]
MGARSPGQMGGPSLGALDVVTPVQGTNDLVVGGKVSKVPGATGNPSFYLVATSNDGQNGCNATGNERATVTLTSNDPSKIPNPSGTFRVGGCGTDNRVTIPYTVSPTATAGEVTMTASVVPGTGRGGTYTPGSFVVSITIPKPSDTTAPVVTPTVTGTAGQNGWYTGNVSVKWNVTDGESAITTPECATTVIDTDTGGMKVSCTATSAGGTTTESVTVKRDATAPVISGEDVVDEKWRNASLSSGEFTASDATSGLSGASPAKFTLTASAESAATSTPTVVSQTVTDQAGNSASRTLSALIDKTKPTASVTPGGKLGLNDWYVGDVTFAASGTDALSGGVTCSQPATLASDSAGHTAATICTDAAGNSATGSATVKRDATAPGPLTLTASGPQGQDGWYVGDVTFAASGTDALSAVTCTPPASLTGDDAGHTASTTCTDAAGNSATKELVVKRDATAPTAAITPGGTQVGGWYNTDVTFAASGTDTLSGGVTCTAIPALTVDSSGTTVSTTCTDAAGNRKGAELTVRRDATAPVISGENVADDAWRNSDLSRTFTAGDGGSGLADGADASFTLTASAESASPSAPTLVSRVVRDNAGNAATRTLSALIDTTAPTAGITPSGTLVNGWYNTDVTFAASGTDTLSGGVTCTAIAALTTDSAATTVKTTCTDAAGNRKDAELGVRRDTGAPTAGITPSGTQVGGWYNTDVTFAAGGTDTLSGGVTCTAIAALTSDTAGSTVKTTCTDTAGNRADATLSLRRDATAPTITGTFASPVLATSGAGATLDSSPLKVADALSGLKGGVTCSQTSLPFGTTPVTCRAEDQAGNLASVTNSVTVTLGNIYTNAYNLLAPLKNTPGDLSLVKLGSTVPVKITAPNYAGGAATDLASDLKMTVVYRNVGTSDQTFEVTDFSAAGSTVWRYDAATNQYVFNLSTRTNFNVGEYDLTITYKGVTLAKGAFNIKR